MPGVVVETGKDGGCLVPHGSDGVAKGASEDGKKAGVKVGRRNVGGKEGKVGNDGMADAPLRVGGKIIDGGKEGSKEAVHADRLDQQAEMADDCQANVA